MVIDNQLERAYSNKNLRNRNEERQVIQRCIW